MYCTRSSVMKIEERGHVEGICNICGSEIDITATGRSLHDGPFALSGGGKVISVGEVYCKECDGAPELPEYGAPISPSEIAEVKSA